jgi:hypothetical protein
MQSGVGGMDKRRHQRTVGLWVGRLWNDYIKWGNAGIFVNEYVSVILRNFLVILRVIET